MPIFTGSRYAGLDFTSVVDSGVPKRFLHVRIPGSLASDFQHTLIAGEELDLLALRYFGQSRLWWKVAEVNDLFWPFDLASGTALNMPAGG